MLITQKDIKGYKELTNFTKKAADEIIPFIKNCNIEGYKNFLNTMYHYTLESERQLLDALNKSYFNEIKEYFKMQAKEERGHYLLAERDLEEFDEKPTTKCSNEIIKFREFWDSIDSKRSMIYLGAQYVFENVASYLAKDVIDMMKRLELTKKQSRWLIVHLEADLGHGAEIEKICLKYLPQHSKEIVYGAEKFFELWTEIFKEAFVEKV